ncbi:F-box/FBD/LRR-repeat protein At4g26340-like [Lotus japonicus]|uniref:F-box/FBD/LRR-repeat protein At4g26340-like n=1 Tax=Lotus japonicus TaxID=34305 RepID=UPI0025865532|nr:F-box/FBD/LRR-repeat protein At4g26340-like [Lotus japonicus]
MTDRISKLPDEVLCHILSYLPTEEAVATSVLSKRWRPLWLSVSSLDFDDDRYLEGKELRSFSSFVNFVYAVILSRDYHQPIKNFSLTCKSDECPYSDVKVWLNAAIQHQVENLEIEFFNSEVPCTILGCTTLVVLKLREAYFDVFSSVGLPSLKTLHLNDVEFLNPQSLMDLLYGCPVLEDLEIHNIAFDDSLFEGKVTSFSKLVRAKVSYLRAFHIPVKAFSNVEFLTLDKCCDGNIPVFSNLIYLEVHSITWSLALAMLNHCPKLQTVDFNLISNDDHKVWQDPCFVPEYFGSHLRKCFLRGFSADECQMRFARYVMQNSTLLRTMIIRTQYDPNHQKKLAMITELASYSLSSAVCELLFK